MSGGLRQPQVDAVPFMFAQLDLDGVTVDALAATYELPSSLVEDALDAACLEGYVRQEAGLYRLTPAGERAAMTRGGSRSRPPVVGAGD